MSSENNEKSSGNKSIAATVNNYSDILSFLAAVADDISAIMSKSGKKPFSIAMFFGQKIISDLIKNGPLSLGGNIDSENNGKSSGGKSIAAAINGRTDIVNIIVDGLDDLMVTLGDKGSLKNSIVFFINITLPYLEELKKCSCSGGSFEGSTEQSNSKNNFEGSAEQSDPKGFFAKVEKWLNSGKTANLDSLGLNYEDLKKYSDLQIDFIGHLVSFAASVVTGGKVGSFTSFGLLLTTAKEMFIDYGHVGKVFSDRLNNAYSPGSMVESLNSPGFKKFQDEYAEKNKKEMEALKKAAKNVANAISGAQTQGLSNMGQSFMGQGRRLNETLNNAATQTGQGQLLNAQGQAQAAHNVGGLLKNAMGYVGQGYMALSLAQNSQTDDLLSVGKNVYFESQAVADFVTASETSEMVMQTNVTGGSVHINELNINGVENAQDVTAAISESDTWASIGAGNTGANVV